MPPLPYGREPWLELERKELQLKFRATGTAQPGQTAELAVDLLDQIAREYWNIWRASGKRAAVFERWLPSIKSRAVTEVGDFWQSLEAEWGEPLSGFRHDCCWPVVEAALSEAVGRWSTKAWRLERQRLDPLCPAIEEGSPNRLAFPCTPGPGSVPGEPSVVEDRGDDPQPLHRHNNRAYLEGVKMRWARATGKKLTHKEISKRAGYQSLTNLKEWLNDTRRGRAADAKVRKALRECDEEATAMQLAADLARAAEETRKNQPAPTKT